MDKKCFLRNPGVIDAILEATMKGGLEEATNLGAKMGVMVAAIVVDGELYPAARAFGNDIMEEIEPYKKWEGDQKIGVNYLGYAFGKLAQSIRTGLPSKEGSALGYGESDDAGSDLEICSCSNFMGPKTFKLLAAFSGMSSKEDFQIAHAACGSGWFEMFGYKNLDGSDTGLLRIVDGHFK